MRQAEGNGEHADAAAARRRELRHASDEALLVWARGHDRDAFDELYRRHHRELRRYARGLTRRLLHHDLGDDMVAEATRKTLLAIQNGNGPTESFRTYLFACVRASTYTQAGRRREEPIEVLPDAAIETADDTLERITVRDAFRTLPHRWQQVLWATNVAGLSATEVADTLGITANAAAVLASRARDGLRIAYIRAQLPITADRPCTTVLNALARRVITPINTTHTRLVMQHTAVCERCHAAADTLEHQLDPRWRSTQATPAETALAS